MNNDSLNCASITIRGETGKIHLYSCRESSPAILGTLIIQALMECYSNPRIEADRHLLIANLLIKAGMTMQHIIGNGSHYRADMGIFLSSDLEAPRRYSIRAGATGATGVTVAYCEMIPGATVDRFGPFGLLDWIKHVNIEREESQPYLHPLYYPDPAGWPGILDRGEMEQYMIRVKQSLEFIKVHRCK